MEVQLKDRSIDEYKAIIKDDVEKIKKIAEPLRNKKIVHINATAFGGGVAEILHNLVPLMRSVGINAKWYAIEAPNEFFNVTKKFHNTLQGAQMEISEQEWKLYEHVCEKNAGVIDEDADIIVVHDPQPAAIKLFAKVKPTARWIWRCHIDLSTPNQNVWDKFSKYLKDYDKMVFHLDEYFPKDMKERCVAFPPSIDPLSDKNTEINHRFIKEILEKLGIDSNRPLITVVARFDPWKDLFSAIDVYRTVKKEIRSVQLAIVSAMASDDPEGWIFFEKVARYAGTDKDILFCTNLNGVGNIEVNAIQRMTTVALHTAIREGFGLVISEALYKNVPVVARPVGGVKIQIKHGECGYLASDVPDLANRVVELMRNEELRTKMGQRGRQIVIDNFIITVNLKNYLKLFLELMR